jgi:hypothetical protein
VRYGPKGMGDGGTVELTEGGGKNGAAMIVWSAGGNTRPGKERRAGGDGVLSMRSRGRTRGERKGGGGSGDGVPFMGDTAGSRDGPLAVPRDVEGGAWGWRGGRMAWVACTWPASK